MQPRPHPHLLLWPAAAVEGGSGEVGGCRQQLEGCPCSLLPALCSQQRTNANRGSASGTVAVTPPPHPLEEPVGRPPLFGRWDLSGIKSILASPTPQEERLVLARAHLTGV